MPAAGPSSLCEVSQDDRTMATLAHALQVVCSWMAPFVILLVKRDSLFIRFHALQALLLQICLLALWMAGAAVFLGTMIATMPASGSAAHNAPPLAVMIAFPIFWLLAMGGWALVLVLAVVYGIKAGRGEWAGYPLIGRVARRLLKI